MYRAVLVEAGIRESSSPQDWRQLVANLRRRSFRLVNFECSSHCLQAPVRSRSAS
jgi:hypothetical protein